MASTPNVPLSEILRSRSQVDDGEPKKKSREDWRKAKELEEARKAGTAPAAVDEDGKDINPHIPQYISSAPWYFGSSGPTLKHQRPQPEKQKEFSKLDEWYKRGVDTTNVAKKFRPGSCENCGASTHKKKDCMERPRKIGAAFTGVQFGPDELLQPNLKLDFDGKRDRWAGYDPSMHQAIVQEYSKVEDAKRRLRAERLDKDNEEKEEIENDEEDEDKYVDDFDMPGTKVDSKQRITVRNLRIREDTAKYLRNLDPDSAYYDPKTRSMRDNPDPKSNAEDTDYAGENFVRLSGDTVRHAQTQQFAWEAHEKGVDVHILAEPTKLEMLQKVYDAKKDEYKEHVQDSVIAKYGGEEHLKPPPKTLLLAQTEEYVEYSRYGKLIKGEEKPIVRSKYEEDVYPGNHSSVFGSYWESGQWGFKCCHSFIKNSYCIGDVWKKKNSPERTATSGPQNVEQEMPAEVPLRLEADRNNDNKHQSDTLKGSDSSSEESSLSDTGLSKELARKLKKELKKRKLRRKLKKQLRKEKKEEKEKSFDYQLKKALKKEDQHRKSVEEQLNVDERKRKYNSMYNVKAPTEAEMEAYYMKRAREDDPMAQFLK